MNQSDTLLAVVIPAYRIQYFGEALASLAAQSDRRFRVYVGDDASPDDLAAVVDGYRDRLEIHYRRFEQNLGAIDLVAHWSRCVALSHGEPWLWLFSDDDVAEPGCVAGFYAALGDATQPAVDIFGFDMEFIDESGRRHHQPDPHPPYETAEALIEAMLTERRRKWRMPDHVFSRAAFERNGGFVTLPKAIYTDCASWLAHAAPLGMRKVEKAKVLWRQYQGGTSSGRLSDHRAEVLSALFGYMEWLRGHAGGIGEGAPHVFERHGRDYFFRELAHLYPPLSEPERKRAVEVAARLWGCSSGASRLRLAWYRWRAQLRYWPVLQSVARWRMRRDFSVE